MNMTLDHSARAEEGPRDGPAWASALAVRPRAARLPAARNRDVVAVAAAARVAPARPPGDRPAGPARRADAVDRTAPDAARGARARRRRGSFGPGRGTPVTGGRAGARR